MIRLVTLYGIGDAYLVCAFAAAFEAERHIKPVVILKSQHAVIGDMFGVDYEVNDALIASAEGDGNLQRCYENLIEDGGTFFVHPHFLRSGVRVDRLTVKTRASQADMYRAFLGISPWAPLAVPRWDTVRKVPHNDVLFVERARSWPNLPGTFWSALASALAPRTVLCVPDSEPLSHVLAAAASVDWVIGPQCGLLSLLIESALPCRKTLLVRELDDETGLGPFGMRKAFPYMGPDTFAGDIHPEVDCYPVWADGRGWDAIIEHLTTPKGAA